MHSKDFSFTKSMYDKCNLEKLNQEATAPFSWVTDNVKEHQDTCFQQQSPFMHNNFPHTPAFNVDISSDLRNQTRHLSRCPEQKFQPICELCNEGLMCKGCKEKIILKDCPDTIEPEYTRLNKACSISSGINVNRFTPLFEDLQDFQKVHSNKYIGMNTRNQVRDAYASKKI